jgi:hypothetical protein
MPICRRLRRCQADLPRRRRFETYRVNGAAGLALALKRAVRCLRETMEGVLSLKSGVGTAVLAGIMLASAPDAFQVAIDSANTRVVPFAGHAASATHICDIWNFDTGVCLKLRPHDGTPDDDKRVAPEGTRCVSVTGAPGDYAIANATITDPTTGGFATVHSSTADWKASSTNNFTAGASLPNLTITKIGADRTICMTSSSRTHMILDVVGYIKATAITPVSTIGADRALDTRRAVSRRFITALPIGRRRRRTTSPPECRYPTLRSPRSVLTVRSV